MSYLWDGVIRHDTVKLTNLDTDMTIYISDDIKVSEDYVLFEADFGEVKASHNFVGRVNQIGGDKTNTVINTRDVMITGYVVGENTNSVEEKKSRLNKMINPLHTLRATLKEERALDFFPTSSIEYATNYEDNNEVMCKFAIQGTAGQPMFFDIEEKIIDVPRAMPTKVFAMNIPIDTGIPLGIVGAGYQRNIENPGDVDCGCYIELERTTMDIVQPKMILQYIKSGVEYIEFMEFDITIGLNQKLVVNTMFGKEEATLYDEDIPVQNALLKMTRDSSVFLLAPSTNVVTIFSNELPLENARFMIKFSPLYLEVR